MDNRDNLFEHLHISATTEYHFDPERSVEEEIRELVENCALVRNSLLWGNEDDGTDEFVDEDELKLPHNHPANMAFLSFLSALDSVKFTWQAFNSLRRQRLAVEADKYAKLNEILRTDYTVRIKCRTCGSLEWGGVKDSVPKIGDDYDKRVCTGCLTRNAPDGVCAIWEIIEVHKKGGE